MKRLLGISAVCCLALLSITSTMAEESPPWRFFAFDNGVGRGVWPPQRQAETVKSLGYDGIHYNYTNPKDFAAKSAACKAAGVPVLAVYIYTFVGKPGAAYDPGIREVIRMLKGSQTMIWMTLRDGKPGQQDAEAAAVVREIAGLAAESGLKVSLYPHAGFYVATAEDAVRIAKQVKLPNVGVTVNLCHELLAGNSARLDEVIGIAKPWLNLVSINGASPVPGKGPKAWETLTLGSGSFDTAAFLKALWKSGYRGPVGHQFYNVKGDDDEKLARAIGAWKKMKSEIMTPAAGT